MAKQHDIVSVALAALLKKDKKSETLKPGISHFDGTVRLALLCEIDKAAPETYRPTLSVPTKALLGMCLAHAGVKIEDVIMEACKEVIAKGAHVADYLKMTEAAIAAAEEALSDLPEATRQGKTIVKGTVKFLELLKA